MRSLFVHSPNDLHASITGGVQICSKEFLDVVRAASDTTVMFEVNWSRKPSLRLRRRLHLGSYLGYDVDAYSQDLQRALSEHEITHVFLNKAELLRFSRLVRQLSRDVVIVVMSHGNYTGDNLYEVAAPDGSCRGVQALGPIWKLGLDLKTESYFRHRFVDAVCALSEEEAVLERWLGAKRVFFMPRIVSFDRLDWNPVAGRVGFVGTLAHPPNRVALERLLPLLEDFPEEFEVELVGGPTAMGEEFQSRFRRVRYRGRLPEGELGGVAGRWALFLNPVFWLSRGASMKLGRALGWGLAVVTTDSGRRGYKIPDDSVVLCRDDEHAFAEAILGVGRDLEQCRRVRAALMSSAPGFPTAVSVGAELRQWLA